MFSTIVQKLLIDLISLLKKKKSQTGKEKKKGQTNKLDRNLELENMSEHNRFGHRGSAEQETRGKSVGQPMYQTNKFCPKEIKGSNLIQLYH